jgi:hypothetical protein
MTGREILAVAGLGEGYDLLILQGEGDPSGGELILADQIVEIRPGLHFRAIPGNRTFGLAVPDGISNVLKDAAGALEAALGYAVSVEFVGSQVLVVVHGAKLPAGVYSATVSDVLMVTDSQFPSSALDMFWMEPHITLADSSVPTHASKLQAFGNRHWRRWMDSRS